MSADAQPRRLSSLPNEASSADAVACCEDLELGLGLARPRGAEGDWNGFTAGRARCARRGASAAHDATPYFLSPERSAGGRLLHGPGDPGVGEPKVDWLLDREWFDRAGAASTNSLTTWGKLVSMRMAPVPSLVVALVRRLCVVSSNWGLRAVWLAGPIRGVLRAG